MLIKFHIQIIIVEKFIEMHNHIINDKAALAKNKEIKDNKLIISATSRIIHLSTDSLVLHRSRKIYAKTQRKNGFSLRLNEKIQKYTKNNAPSFGENIRSGEEFGTFDATCDPNNESKNSLAL